MTERLLEGMTHAEEFGSPDGDESAGMSDVVEVPLLLSGRQMLALEEMAHHRGLTAGEMVRRLLHDFISTTLAYRTGH
jgi:hypothetical protein